jgi:hypothetical protein
MHRGKIVRFALAMKAEGMPLPNPAVDLANESPLLTSARSHGRFFVARDCKFTSIVTLSHFFRKSKILDNLVEPSL